MNKGGLLMLADVKYNVVVIQESDRWGQMYRESGNINKYKHTKQTNMNINKHE